MPPLQPPHTALRSLRITVRCIIQLCGIADICRGAPQLSGLHFEYEDPTVCLTHASERVRDTSIVNERLSAGLALTIQEQDCTATAVQSMAINSSLVYGPETDMLRGDVPGKPLWASCLQACHPLLNTKCVDVYAVNCQGGASCLTHLTRVFPLLEQLTLCKMQLKDSDLLSLTPCKALWSLGLHHVSGVNASGSAQLCAQMPSLCMLCFFHCKDCLGSKHRDALERLLQGQGSAVDVQFEHVVSEFDEIWS